MKKTKGFLTIGIICLILAMHGVVEEPDPAFAIGFMIPSLLLLFLHFRAELRETRAKPVTLPLILICLFCAYMAVVELQENEAFGAAIGLSVAIPLLLEILLRLRNRRLYGAPKKEEPQAPVGAPVRSPAPAPRERAVRRCPGCGAPGRGDICEYCGGPL